MTADEYNRRLARAKEARRVLKLRQPVRRRIVATVWPGDVRSLKLSCRHVVPWAAGAREYAECVECGRQRAKRAGVE